MYCTTKNGCCHSGLPIVPGRKDTIISYVEEAKSDKNWVIVKAVNKDQTKSYWFLNKNFKLDLNACTNVNCDSIIHSNTIGPLSIELFKNKVHELNINLGFE